MHASPQSDPDANKNLCIVSTFIQTSAATQHVYVNSSVVTLQLFGHASCTSPQCTNTSRQRSGYRVLFTEYAMVTFHVPALCTAREVEHCESLYMCRDFKHWPKHAGDY